ncbi:putative uncharacterized protein [Clostridium sp. CAG:411]|jgi:hypothetical protein|nr:putative uncharacterized protein [Clostridium sp. CAG:411]
MNKYDILEEKLIAINAYIDTMHLENNATMEYLKQYKDYVNKLIIAIQNRTIRNSNGAMMGLIRGISDYDELCADDAFWRLVTDADNYYCNECQLF